MVAVANLHIFLSGTHIDSFVPEPGVVPEMTKTPVHSACIWLLSSVLFLLACATDYTREMRPVTSDLRTGRPDLALEEFREVFTDSTGGDRLLYLMELGNLLRLSGDHSRAVDILLQADRLSDQQRGIELGQQVEAFLTSDLALEFRGADYEKVFLNYCLAASYACMNNMEDALVECRRVNDKLRALNVAYEDNPNRYSDDAFVRYLMGVLFEKAGDLNNALVAYRNSAAVYDSCYAGDYGIPAPVRVKSDILRLSNELGMQSVFQEYSNVWPDVSWEGLGPVEDNGEIVVIVEIGLIPSRRERTSTFLFENRVFRISIPFIPQQKESSLSLILSSGRNRTSGFLAEDLTGIAIKNLEDHAGRDITRALARLAIKAGIAEAGEEVVEELTSRNSGISEVTGLVLSFLGAATEHADLRAWLTLPSRIYVARLTLAEGDHPVTVRLNGKTILSRSITVSAGEINLIFLRDSQSI